MTQEHWKVEGFTIRGQVGRTTVEADTRYQAIKKAKKRGLVDVFSAKRNNPMSGGGLKGHR